MATAGVRVPTYLKNLGKSLGYGLQDAVAGYNPVLKELIKDSKDAADDLFSDIKSFKSDLSLSDERSLMGELKESGKDIFKNLMDDIKTGNLYNKDRDGGSSLALAAMGFDMSDFDVDFDDWGDDDWTSSDSEKAAIAQDVKNTQATINAMDIVGGKISKSISSTTARSAQQIVNVTRQGNRALYNLNQHGFNNVSKMLLNVNNSIVSFAKIGEPMSQHFQNSSIFYTKTTESLNKIEQHLANIESKLPTYEDKKEQKFATGGLGSIFSSDTGISISAYKDMVKANFADDKWLMDSLISGVKNIKNAKGSGSLGKNISIGTLMVQFVTKAMIPKIIGESMKSMNYAIRDFMGAAFEKVRASNSGNPLIEILKDYFLPKENYKGSINTGNYTKGAVAWDGYSKKALTEVIPTYLSMIYGAITGKDMRYNYEKGKFVTLGSIAEGHEKDKRSHAANTGGKFRNDVVKKLKKQNPNMSDEAAQQLADQYFYNAMFGTDEQRKNYANVGHYDFGANDARNLGIDASTLSALKEVLKDYKRLSRKGISATAEERDMARRWNEFLIEINNGKDSWYNRMSAEEASGTSMLNHLYNGSSTAHNKSNMFANINSALTNIEKSLVTIIPGYLELMLNRMNTGKGGKKRGYTHYDEAQGRWITQTTARDINNRVLRGVERESTTHSSNQTASSNNQSKSSSSSDDDGDGGFGTDYSMDEEPKINGVTEEENSKLKKAWKRVTKWFKGVKNNWVTMDPGKAGGLVAGVSNILNSVSYSVNTLFMGTDDKDENGLIHVLKDEVTKAFSGLTDLYEKYLKEHVNKFKKFLEDKLGPLFGEGTTLGGYLRSVKDKAKEWAGGMFTSARHAVLGKSQNEVINEKTDELMATGNFASRAQAKAEAMIQLGLLEQGDGYAYGGTYYSRRRRGLRRYANGGNVRDLQVPRTGLAVVSEGELIIPSEFNPFYRKPTNKAEQIRKENAIAKKYMGSYPTGGNAGDPNHKSFLELIAEGFGQIIGTFTNGAKGNSSNQQQQESNKATNAIKDFIDATFGKENRKDNLVSMGTGALFGAGVSVLTGAVVGPLFGAAIGAGVGLVANSEAVQKVLFGDIDENGRFDDETMRGKIGNFFKENLKSTAIGGGIGLLAGTALGSPVIGLIAGSAIGFAKSSSAVQETLFGKQGDNGEWKDTGLIPKEIQEKIKAMMPRAVAGGTLGAITGAATFGGPFGIVGGLLLGSALGVYSGTEDFHDRMFGKDGDEKSRKNSIFYQLKTKIFDNIDDIAHNTKNMIKGILLSVGTNIKHQIRGGFTRFFDFINNIKNKAKNGDGSFLTNLIGGALNLGEKVTKGTIGAIGAPLKGISTFVSNRNLARGYNVYGVKENGIRGNLNARERDALRRQRGQIDAFGTDRYSDFDVLLANARNPREIQDIINKLQEAQEGNVDQTWFDKKFRELDIKDENGNIASLNMSRFNKGEIAKLVDLAKTEKAEGTRNWDEEERMKVDKYHFNVLRNFEQVTMWIKKLYYKGDDEKQKQIDQEYHDKLYGKINSNDITEGHISNFGNLDSETAAKAEELFNSGKYGTMDEAIEAAKAEISGYNGNFVHDARAYINNGALAKKINAWGSNKAGAVKDWWRLFHGSSRNDYNLASSNSMYANQLNEAYEQDARRAEAARDLAGTVGEGLRYFGQAAYGGTVGLPFFGNYGLGGIISGAWNGIKSIGGKALSLGAKALPGVLNATGNALSAFANTKGSFLGRAGAALNAASSVPTVPTGGMGGMGNSQQIDNGGSTVTVFDAFANPHQYTRTEDGELVEQKNDRETDAARASMDSFGANIASVPLIGLTLSNIYRLLSGMAGKVGVGGEAGGEGSGGAGLGGGLGSTAANLATGAVGGGFLNMVKDVLPSALGVAMLTGGADKFGEAIGNLGFMRGNNTKSVYSAQSKFIDGHQIYTDASGNYKKTAEGFYMTMDGFFIDPKTGQMYDGSGNPAGFADLKNKKTLGTDNTTQARTFRNLFRESVNSIARNGNIGAAGANSVVGKILNYGGFKNMFKESYNWGDALRRSNLFSTEYKNVGLFGGKLNKFLPAKLQSKFAGNQVRKGVIPRIGDFFSRNTKKLFGETKLYKKGADSVSDIVKNIPKTFNDTIDNIFLCFKSTLKNCNFVPRNCKNKGYQFIDEFAYKIKVFFGDNPNLISKAEKAAAKEAAMMLDALFFMADFANGWGYAPTYLGIITPYRDLDYPHKFLGGFINATWNLIPFIAAFIPTQTIYTWFYEASSKVGWDLSVGGKSWGDLRAEATKTVEEYNKANNTNLSIEEYNEMNGNYGIMKKVGNNYKEDLSSLGGTFKEDGFLGSLKNMGGAGLEFGKDLLGKYSGKAGRINMDIDLFEESSFGRALMDNELSQGLDWAASTGDYGLYDKGMMGLANAINWSADTADKYSTSNLVLGASKWASSKILGEERANNAFSWLAGGNSGLRHRLAGKGSAAMNKANRGFVSQLNPRYSGMRIGNTTVDEAGCAPAVATMVANSYGKDLSMQSAVNKANNYQQGADGTTINYFGDTLAEQGIATSALNSPAQIMGNLMHGNNVILLGQDANNNNKAVSPFGPNPHFVDVMGLDEKGNFITRDPESSKATVYPRSILNSSLAAIGTSLGGNNRAAFGGSRRSGGSRARSTASRAASTLKNAGKNLMNSIKSGVSGLMSLFGRGTKGPAYPAEIYSWLIQNGGLEDFQAAAIIGCWQCESGNAPMCIEGYYLKGFPGYEAVASPDTMDAYCQNILFPAYKSGINKEAYKVNGKYFPGLGLAGWTGNRAGQLLDYAESVGKPWYDLDVQINFFWNEMKGKYSGVLNNLKASTNIEDAVEIFATGFEHGSFKRGTKHYNDRLNAARTLFSQLAGRPLADVSDLSNLTPSSSSSSSDSSNNGDPNGDWLQQLQAITPSSEGTLLDKINQIFSIGLGALVGKKGSKSNAANSANGYYDENGNWVSLESFYDIPGFDGKTIPEKLVAIAANEVGYREKASNSQLDDKLANAGSNNYTKYGVFTGTNGLAWCASFVSWVFDKLAQGDPDRFKQLVGGPKTAGVANLRSYAQNTGRYVKNPMLGDIIIYSKGSHTGIVSGVKEDGSFSAIDGNCGDVVCQRKFMPLDRAAGFLRPDWSAVADLYVNEQNKSKTPGYYLEPNNTYVNTGRMPGVPEEQLKGMVANGTIYDYALKNFPGALGFLSRNKFLSMYGNSTAAEKQLEGWSANGYNIAEQAMKNNYGSAIAYIDPSKVYAKNGMPEDVFRQILSSKLNDKTYPSWVLSTYPDAFKFDDGSTWNSASPSYYPSDQSGTKASDNAAIQYLNGGSESPLVLNNLLNDGFVETNGDGVPMPAGSGSGLLRRPGRINMRSFNALRRWAGRGSGTVPTTPVRVNSNPNAFKSLSLPSNMQIPELNEANVTYINGSNDQANATIIKLLAAIVNLLSGISNNTGSSGSLFTLLSKYLPEGTTLDEATMKKIIADAMAAGAAAGKNASENNGIDLSKILADARNTTYMGT